MESQLADDVPHIMQDDSWDCGMACAKMVLRFTRPDCGQMPTDFNEVCEGLGIGKSVWTIDLAHVLLQYGIKHKMYTVTLGANPAYEELTFYNQEMKTEFIKEQERVDQQFASAASKGVQVEKRSLPIEEIVNNLLCNQPAIVLVDDSILHCERCEQSRRDRGCSINCFSSGEDTSYIGHFIVLCGVHVDEKMFLYRNPGISESICCCSFDNLDKARRSLGTDEDILFIYR